jgi:hypothetical protein
VALIALEGWDKFGPPNSNFTVVAALLTAGEWTNATGSGITIVAGLSATGQAVQIALTSSTLSKTLPASYGRLIGGFRFNVNTLGTSNLGGIQFTDGATGQCTLGVNPTTGLISLRNASVGGATLAVSTIAVSVGSTHYLEWDITFGNAGVYSVWMDGSLLFSGTGDTTANANNTANGIMFLGAVSGPTITFDDLYIFDASGTTNNAVLLTSPRIETQFPNRDGAVQFAIGASVIGSNVSRASGGTSNIGNTLYLRPLVSVRACTLTAIGVVPNATSGAVQMRPAVYADNGGTPNGGALLGSGPTITGVTSGVALVMPLTTPVSLSAGTSYWLGWMNDIGVTSFIQFADTLATGRFVAATFSSGAPATVPTTTVGSTPVVWGAVTGIGVNWYEVAQSPTQGNNSFVYDTTTGHQDLYNFPALSFVPTTIYAVAAKAAVAKSDAGARTLSVRLKSGATDSAGSGGTQTAGTSYGWVSSLHPVDPATGAAWTTAGANAAQIGVRVE